MKRDDWEMALVVTLAAYGLMKMCEALLFEQKESIKVVVLDKSELEKINKIEENKEENHV